MRSNAMNRLLVAVAATAFLAACSSKPVEEDVVDDVEQSTVTAPVKGSESSKADYSHIPLTADGFHNHPSKYDGTTVKRIIYFEFYRSDMLAADFDHIIFHAKHFFH